MESRGRSRPFGSNAGGSATDLRHGVRGLRVLVPLLPLLLLPGRASSQSAPHVADEPEPVVSERDARQALSDARSAQRRFELLRRQRSPTAHGGWSGGRCDEIVGRMCLRYHSGGDWWPAPEDRRIVEARMELLERLEESARLLPTEPWILGQRVLYLGEAGLWEEAEALAAACITDEQDWCGTLLGLALHAQGRYLEAEESFRRALYAMDPGERLRWTDPRVLLDGEGRRYLSGKEGEEELAAREWVWRLSNPLYLVAGNDRLTEHWSRLTVSRARENATNPYGLSWGRDLEEILVRYGWEVGWERLLPRVGEVLATSGAVGHHHPEIRRYVPPGRALGSPGEVVADEWRLSAAAPRDGHAPPYAPVIIPADGEVVRFPRGDRVALVGVFGLPEDTTFHSRHDHPPFEPPAPHGDRPLQAGLFLVPVDGGEALAGRSEGERDGALLVEAPAGEYVVSLEVWNPAEGLAGRLREGLLSPAAPPDVASLSGLLVLEELLPDSAGLADAVGFARPPSPIGPGDALVVGWEVYGFGWRPEILSYSLTLERGDRSLLRRVGERLGLARPPEPQSLAWEEAAPERPGPAFRTVSMELPELEAGSYTLRLELSTAGRRPLVSERTVEVAAP